MINSILLAVQSTVPDTPAWTPGVTVVMLICIVLGLIIARIGIQNKGKGPKLPLLEPVLGAGAGWPELIAGISIGHLLGVGSILGLTNTGLF